VPCPSTQQAKLPAYSPHDPFNAERQAMEAKNTNQVLWSDSTTDSFDCGSTDCEANATFRSSGDSQSVPSKVY